MKKKNWFALLLTAALSLSLLTGCGGSSKQSDAASGDNSADAPAASESRLDKVLAAGKITNVCEPYFAPYEFIDNTKSGQEQFRGADMELARYIAKELGVLTVGVVTKPFRFEGMRRMKQAEGGITELRNKVDSLVIIPNERLKLATDQKITMVNAFEIADDVLQQAVQSISDLIKNTGFINLDFADVTAIMKNAGMAHMGVGRAAGKGKAEEAARMAISSPLLETSIEGAKGVLINVTGSMDIGLEEVEQAASLVQQAVHPDALTIFGATFDETMDDEIRVTVIATGFDKAPETELPKIGSFQKPTVQLEGQEKEQAKPAVPFAPIEPIAPETEKAAEPEPDPFDDIFKIFNRRD